MAPRGRRAGRAQPRQSENKAPVEKKATPKKAAKPKRRSSTYGTAAFGGHYDAFQGTPQPIARAIGHATNVRGFGRRNTPSTPPDAQHSMMVFTVAPSFYCGTYGFCNDQDEWRVSSSDVNTNHFEMPNTGIGSQGGPTQVLTGKMSVRVRNTTKVVDAGGTVYALMFDSGADLETLTNAYASADGWTSLRNFVMGSPRTRTFSAAELLKTRQWNLHPTDATRAIEFHSTQEKGHAAILDDYRKQPVFSQLVLVFSGAHPYNSFEFSFANQIYTRYEIGGPLANAAQPVPTAPVSVIDGARKIMEEVGSAGHLAREVIGVLGSLKAAV